MIKVEFELDTDKTFEKKALTKVKNILTTALKTTLLKKYHFRAAELKSVLLPFLVIMFSY